MTRSPLVPARRDTALRARHALAAAVFLLLLPGGIAFARDETEIVVHFAYGTASRFRLEGRVAERDGRRPARDRDSWARNLWRSIKTLREEERKDVEVRLSLAGRTWTVRTDGEGYFAASGDLPHPARVGWNGLRVECCGGARADVELLVVPDHDTVGIISDFDDTVIVSEVTDRSRLASHTLLENHLQRRPVEGMAALYRAILARNPFPAAAPAIYLTASPRQLQRGIAAFLEHNGFPRGPIVAKKVAGGDGGDPLLDQERYKTDRIEQVLADLPGVRFVLVGDDGERDPEIYDAIRARHPGRIEAVYIRQTGARPDRPMHPGQSPPPVPGR